MHILITDLTIRNEWDRGIWEKGALGDKGRLGRQGESLRLGRQGGIGRPNVYW